MASPKIRDSVIEIQTRAAARDGVDLSDVTCDDASQLRQEVLSIPDHDSSAPMPHLPAGKLPERKRFIFIIGDSHQLWDASSSPNRRLSRITPNKKVRLICMRCRALFFCPYDTPVRLDRIYRQISTAIPFHKIPPTRDLHELGGVAKVLKRLIFQIGIYIETANATVVCNEGQDPIRLWTDFFDSHWSRPLLLDIAKEHPNEDPIEHGDGWHSVHSFFLSLP